MLDVFNEEHEVIIKDGIANLYWYRGDLKKAWLRSGVDNPLSEQLFCKKTLDGKDYTKRQLMDLLYEELRKLDYNRRLEISRNFVRILIQQKDFVPQDPKHRVEVAERCALKLREIITEQEKEREYREQIRIRTQKESEEAYFSQLLKLRERFTKAIPIENKKRGYELEQIFNELMKVSGIPVEQPFKIVGEQIDGAIKYDGHFYLVELKWIGKKCNQKEIASHYMKVEGKFETRGIFVAMNGFSEEVLSSLPKGKEIKVLLLDGVHLTSVIYGNYTFQELLEHAISQASVKGEIYCSHSILN